MRNPLSLALSLAVSLAVMPAAAQSQDAAAPAPSAPSQETPAPAPPAPGAPARTTTVADKGAGSQGDRQPAPEDAAETPRIFIEESLVLAPEQVGDFVLNKLNDFPGNPGAGIGVRYQHRDFPQVRIDVFVYPAGRVDRDEVLAGAIEQVRGDLQNAAQQGSYRNLVIGDAIPFDLRRVDSDGSLRAAGEAPGDEASPDESRDDGGTPDEARGDGGSPDEAESDEASPGDGLSDLDVLTALADAETTVGPSLGRLLEISLEIQGEPMNSRAFLFYRGLFLFKGRISATAIDLPGEAFERFTQHAMATLVPAIQVRSTGGCHRHEVYVDVDEKADGPDGVAAQLMGAALRGEFEQCGPTLDRTVPEGFQAKGLVFDAAMWGG